ncbi:MAG: HAMP domain-containing histidine kinase [Candidatus Omnitrophica bacterium]|nr:HAMP domain-containing histidine kinase [Candidatus Omnitrophota bacterium]MDE2009222.1 HAMP domain-containing histidine kinase [Candidatus Omnitrophota bacterium]MDE2213743.1 HAMP domain-containing histidine kinase [Candidatus Omnitrophota bacterium]
MKANFIKFEISILFTVFLGLILVVFSCVLYFIYRDCRSWAFAIAVSVPLVLALTNFVGKVLAKRVLQPVQEITDMARRITRHDLSARIRSRHFDPGTGPLIESFNEMIARLETSFKHIEQFSCHVAHELKTPLTIIQGEAELLLRRDRHVQEYKQALRIVMEESQRVLKTIDDLLLLTKLGYSQEVFKFEHFDFIEFFNEIIEQNRLLAANRGVGIRTDFYNIRPPLMIKADRLHLRRLFFNLIDNAIKFTPEGGCVDTHIGKDNGRIIGLISDTGPGIASDKLERIFEAFTGEGKDMPEGGLGLSIAYKIARLHDGDIRVESRPGRGSAFTVVLPSVDLAWQDSPQVQN